MYVCRVGELFIAFDTGMSPGIARSQLSRLHIDPLAIRHVFLTHSDFDHAWGLAAFPNAKVYISKDEIPLITRIIPRAFGFYYNRPLATAYQTLEDGQELVIADATVRCIATPGHTPGSMSFLINESILIVGDECFLDDGEAVLYRHKVMQGVFHMDRAVRAKSLLILSRLTNISFLCTMHSGYSSDFKKAMDAWPSRLEL
jgi:glyoxylase-like metal-dependent hydrolase (beta-lactamase superfamily II)